MAFSPEWIAIGRELALAVEQFSVGVTALGRAHYGQTGYYALAFSGMSLGYERLAKLCIVADLAMNNGGRFPHNNVLKSYSHDLMSLFARCDDLSATYRPGQPHAVRPADPIHTEIIAVLNDFAQKTRYYNLDLLVGGPASTMSDPIVSWWGNVAEPLITQYRSPRQLELDRRRAKLLSAKMEQMSSVLFHSEMGSEITDVETMAVRSFSIATVQKYGRLYCLQIVRWLAYLLRELSDVAGDTMRIEALAGMGECLAMFLQDDRYFKSRKTWAAR